jgi:hypothetical protein
MRGKSMRKIFDRGITITPKRGRIAGPSAKVRTAYCLSLMLLALQAISIQSSKADMNLKLYAYNKLDWQEFQCYNWLIFKESSWNPRLVMDRTMALVRCVLLGIETLALRSK